VRCLPATRLGAARQESDTSAAMRRALSTEYKALLLEIVKGDGPGIGEAVRGLDHDLEALGEQRPAIEPLPFIAEIGA
jgi:hypothetical protein